MPGVTVTVTGPVLLRPLTAVTSEAGTYQFPRLEIGSYTVKFELTGFKTVVSENVRVTVGYSAQINASLSVSVVQETVTVSSESPIVDTKETGTRQPFTNELLQSIPWRAIEHAATAPHGVVRLELDTSVAGRVTASVTTSGLPVSADDRADVIFAIVEDALRTEVKRVENKGRTLINAAVVREMVMAGEAAGDGAAVHAAVRSRPIGGVSA
jgi:hypothetical protein